MADRRGTTAADELQKGTAHVPLAATQRRMWLHEQLLPGQVEYNVVDSWALTGPVDVPALEAAVRDVTQRHEALRSTFHLEDGRPIQRFHPIGAGGLEVIPGFLDEPTALERCEALAGTRFSLTSAPLVRWTLISTAADRHLLQIVAHHLVIDGWSLEILVEELSECYAARLRGAEPELADIPMPYGAYATRGSDPETLRQQTEHWKEVLRDLPSPTRLPAPGSGAVERPIRQSLAIEAELIDRVKRVAKAEGVTPSAVWLVCFAAVLGRWSGSRDVVVGSPLSGRTSIDLLKTVGFLIATVVLRFEMPEGATGRDMLARAHRVLIDAQLNQDVPFDDVVAAVRPERRADAAPPFSTWFNVLSYPTKTLRLGEARGERVPAPVPGSPFGLSLYVDQRRAGAVRLDLVHGTGRLERPYGKALLDQMLVLARAITEDVTVSLDAVPLTETAPRATEAAVAETEGIGERLRRHPADAVAVVDEEGQWTYGELLTSAGDISGRLKAAGLKPGDLVEIAEAPGRRLAAAILGVWECEGVFLLTDPGHPANWRRRLRAKARPRFTLSWTGPGADLQELDPRAVAPAQRVKTGGRPDAGRPLYVLPTSGTTREPRLVLGAEKPLLAFLAWWSRRYSIGPQDRFCALSGLSHDPLLRDLLLPLWNGGVLTIPASGHRVDPARAAAWLAARRVSVVHVTPLVGRLIAQAAQQGGISLEHVRLVCFGGDVLTDATVCAWREAASGARLVSVYGTTETPQAASCFDVPPGSLSKEPSLGHGAVDAQLAIVTAAGMAAPGEVGEIVVRSPLLTMGYLDDDATTESSYESDLWGDPGQAVFRTGDVGRLRWDGTVSFLGRDASMVKTRGHRVSLPQLAAELRAVPGVADAVVVQRTESSETRLIAYVVPVAGAAAVPARILDDLAQAVPSGFLPDDVCVLDALPVTPNGKLDRDRLPMTGTGLTSTATPVPRPRDESGGLADERTVAAVWQEVLGVPRVGLDDNFFDLGGTSVTAVQLRARLESRLNRSLPPLLVFQSSTVRRMAQSLSGFASVARAASGPAAGNNTRELRRAARAALTPRGGKR
ncbi:condensation domain-containing protein [Streptomyces globosus]|uniref:condensation domain-containing protein n=1 Tax=Streptomyces globosus TaxID=68209 RepID=UPI003809D392